MGQTKERCRIYQFEVYREGLTMQFKSEKDIYIPKDRRVEYVKVGDTFTALPRGVEFSNVRDKKSYRVFGVYPYHVTAIAEDGEIRSFCLGELVKLGLEPCGARVSDAGYVRVKDYD